MKKLLPILVLLLAVALVAKSFRAPKMEDGFDVAGFGQLPVLVNGRIKPLDTLARSSLLQLQGRQSVKSTFGEKLVSSPSEWLLDVTLRPEKADTYPTFKIDNPDLLALLGKTEENRKINYPKTAQKIRAVFGFLPSSQTRFSFEELRPHLGAIQDQAKLANNVDAQLRTGFQQAVIQLYHNLVQYQRLRFALVAPGRRDFLNDLLKMQDHVREWVAAVRAREAGQPHDEAAAKAAMELGQDLVDMGNTTNIHAVPPDPGIDDPTAWKPVGGALLETFRTGRVNATALSYAGFARAWRDNQPEHFNKLLELVRADLVKRFGPELKKAKAETRFNAAEPFFTSTILYGMAFALAVFSWLAWPKALGRSAFLLVTVAWLIATGGIVTRMWLEGRPPVTNLYSSALFVGWGAVALCLILEYIYKNAIGSVAAGMIGFATLLVAHFLSLSGDTLEMMRAVLDSNFWLATHVVVITIGYSATFLAGFLSVIYILRGVFTKTLSKPLADSLARMVYGIVCFATLFSFVGTILGGIWADQSWGRFWGWDPKENGALIIVLWNAIILHARWGGMIQQRGLMCLAVFGNIVTSWSWFGTNMLPVGLHSYGRMDEAYFWLVTFVVSQLAIIATGNLPLAKWRSFKDRPSALPAAPEHVEEVATAK